MSEHADEGTNRIEDPAITRANRLTSPAPSPGVLRQRLWARARIRHLKTLVEVAKEGSLHKAAESLGISQPAVSNLLSDLERMLETPLFVRHARGMRPTDAGAHALQAARRMLAEIDNIAEEASALQTGAKGVVRMAAVGGAVTGFLTAALPELSRLEPRVLLRLQEADPTAMSALLAGGEIDIAPWRTSGVVPSGWRFRELIPDRFAVVAGPQHPLARYDEVSLDELRREPWFAAPIDSAALKAIDALFGVDKPAAPALQIACRIPEILLAMLTSTRQVTLVPVSVVRQFLETGLLVELAVDRQLPFEPLGLFERDERTNDAVRTISDFLVDFAQSWRPGGAAWSVSEDASPKSSEQTPGARASGPRRSPVA